MLALVALFLASQPAWAAAGRARTRSQVRRLYDPRARPLPNGGIVRLSGEGETHNHMDQASYTDLRNASIQLLKKYPPSQHVYVGLGRDPAPFIAFLQVIGTRALNFPASGGAFQASEELDRHFTKLIPRSVRFGNKTILLIDQTSSGKTHAALMPLLKRYLKRTGSKVDVKGVAFYEAPRVSMRLRHVETINVTNYPEVGNFLYSPYEGVVSPFERHVPDSEAVEDLTWRPQYERFKDAIRKRAQRDARLDRFLVSLGPRQRAVSRAAVWQVRNPYRKGLPRLGSGPILKVGDDRYPVLDAEGYASISRSARDFLDRFPPDGRYYVGVGRSSTPLMAYLDNLGTRNLGYLPADGMTEENMSRSVKEKLAAYLAQAIPAGALKAGLTLTFFQRSETGYTLLALKTAAERWVKATGSRSAVEVVAMGPEDPAVDEEMRHVKTRTLRSGGYLGSSIFPYHRIGKHDLSELKPRPAYAAFKKSLLQRLQRDGELDEFLRQPE